MAPMTETAVSPGRTIGRFRLEALIGEGATGLVFRAGGDDGATVAVKQLRPELVEDEAALARFRREALLAQSVTTPHLAPILELGEADGLVYLVQPYYERGSLAALLRSARRLDPEVSCRLAAQLARGLDALHERGVLHRDVKPSNVLLDGAGGAALADFGLARGAESTRLTADGQILGTAHYLAPELIEGSEASRQSDIYALGCVVYECLVGEPPFGGRAPAEIGFAHLVEAPPDPRERWPELPRGLADAVLASLEKEPAARPTTATALARMLQVGCSSLPG
jgi:eukaryotic-like serine/threonine-protein kinase